MPAPIYRSCYIFLALGSQLFLLFIVDCAVDRVLSCYDIHMDLTTFSTMEWTPKIVFVRTGIHVYG